MLKQRLQNKSLMRTDNTTSGPSNKAKIKAAAKASKKRRTKKA